MAALPLGASRRVLRVAGADAIHFLNGLLTNDVTRLAATSAPPVYAALLTPAAKVVADVHVQAAPAPAPVPASVPVPASPSPALLADVDAGLAPGLLRLLGRYRLRADVDVADASDEWGVWWWPGGVGGGVGGGDPTTTAHPLPPPPPGLHPDPRGLAGLGWRGLVRHADVPESGGVEASTSGGGGGGGTTAAAAAAARLRAARFALGVADGADLAGLMPLEAGLDALHGIAFDKGCYVGQELVARTHFRGAVRKRVVPMSVDGGGRLPPAGARLSLPSASANRPPGTVLAVDDATGTGLALVRTAAALPAGVLEWSDGGVGGGGGGRARVARPAWWPAGWGDEDGD